MAIGKPLLVNQRRGVPNPVLSAQTQQLSSNVPVQKLAMLDYSIGQNNAKAAGAVSSELLSMIDKGMQAALYVDNTKREYKRLSLMEDWQKSNMDFQGRFAQARTPDAQATVIADYENDTQNRIAAYSESQGTGTKQKAQLADLRNTANTQFSKFSVTHQNSLFKQTAGMLQTDTATIAQSVVEDVNIDPVSAFKKISDNFGEMVGIGALDATTARYQQGLLQDKMITGRSGLFARNYAKDVLAEGRKLPSDQEFKTQINGVMGLELSERRLKLASRSFTDTYYKELKSFNSQVAAEDAHNKEAISEDLAAFESEYKEEILNKLLTSERKEELINKAKQFDGVEDGYSGRIKVLLDAVQFGTPSQPVVDEFTLGQAGLDLQAVLHAGGQAGHGVDYYDLEAVEYAARNAGGEYAGMNENTILGIVKYYRNENAALITQFSQRVPLLLKTNIVAALKNKDIFLQSDEPGMTPEFWNAMAATRNLNWSSTFAQDPAYGEAFARVESVLAQAANKGTGPYDKDEIGDDVAARTVALNSFIQRTIATEFGAATAQKKAKSKATEDKLVEGDKDQSRRNFRLGGTTAKGQPYAGALQDSAKNLTDTLSKQGVDKYQGITERIATDLKRMKAEAQPEWVKKTDKALAAIGSKIVEKIPTMKDVASMVMGNVPTSYITGVKNKKLLNELQDMVGRPLTPDELAGKDEDINEMSRTIIKRDSQIPVVGFITSIFSGSAAETEKKLENLAYEFKHQSLEGIQKGLESAKPKPEPLPVVEKPRTAIEDLAQGAEGNPLLKGAMELASSVLSPSEAEGASTYQDPNFDPTATGPRGFDQDNQPQEGTRNELAQALGLTPDSAGARFEGGTSEESDIEGYTEEQVDMPPVVMDEIVVSDSATPLNRAQQRFEAFNQAFPDAEPSERVKLRKLQDTMKFQDKQRVLFDKSIMDKELGLADRKVMKGMPYISSTLAGPGKIKDSQGNLLPEDKREPQLNLSRKQRPVKNISDAPMTNNLYEASTVKSGLTIGFGHDVTQAELRAGAIHGITFIDSKTGNFIDLNNTQLEAIFQKDLQGSNEVAKQHFNNKGFGISFEDIPEELQLFLAERAFSTGTNAMPDADAAFKKALGLKESLSRSLKDKRINKKSKAYNLQVKELKKAVDSFIFNVKERKAIQPRVDALFKMANTKDGLYRFFNLHGNYEGK